MATESTKRRWEHTRFLGFATMGIRHMEKIIDGKSTTQESKNQAMEILHKLAHLEYLLKEKVDA